MLLQDLIVLIRPARVDAGDAEYDVRRWSIIMFSQVLLKVLTENVLGSVLAGVSAKEKPYGAINNLLTVSAVVKRTTTLTRHGCIPYLALLEFARRQGDGRVGIGELLREGRNVIIHHAAIFDIYVMKGANDCPVQQLTHRLICVFPILLKSPPPLLWETRREILSQSHDFGVIFPEERIRRTVCGSVTGLEALVGACCIAIGAFPLHRGREPYREVVGGEGWRRERRAGQVTVHATPRARPLPPPFGVCSSSSSNVVNHQRGIDERLIVARLLT